MFFLEFSCGKTSIYFYSQRVTFSTIRLMIMSPVILAAINMRMRQGFENNSSENMGRKPASSATENGKLRRGTWTAEEDMKLLAYVSRYGCWNWRQLPKYAGLARCGKSCRLRWMNYLKPDLKRGNYTKEEEDTIIRLHEALGNKWSMIAAQLPGRTDNEVKNLWHSKLKKKLEKTPSFKNGAETSSGSSTSSTLSVSACRELNTKMGLMDQEINNSAEDSISYCSQLCKFSKSSSSSEGFSAVNDVSGDFWTDPFAVDSAYNDADYYHYMESLAAASDFGYYSLLSSPLPSHLPNASEDELWMPLWQP